MTNADTDGGLFVISVAHDEGIVVVSAHPAPAAERMSFDRVADLVADDRIDTIVLTSPDGTEPGADLVHRVEDLAGENHATLRRSAGD